MCSGSGNFSVRRRTGFGVGFVAPGQLVHGPVRLAALTHRPQHIHPLARISNSLPAYRLALLKACPRQGNCMSLVDVESAKASESSKLLKDVNVNVEADMRMRIDTLAENERREYSTLSGGEAMDIVKKKDEDSITSTSTGSTSTSTTRESNAMDDGCVRWSDLELRYSVRTAQHFELYTVADIRCEAFYCSAQTASYHPVRRREIYMAMKSRISAGTCCVVIIDSEVPREWQSFRNEEGLVVGTLDITLHECGCGERRFVEDGPFDSSERDVCAYISSMAIRQSWQGLGLAQRLMEYTKQTVGGVGVSNIFLHVDADNEAAKHVYAKAGFQVVGCTVPMWIHTLAKSECKLMHLGLGGTGG